MDLHGIKSFDWSIIIVTYVTARPILILYAEIAHYSS